MGVVAISTGVGILLSISIYNFSGEMLYFLLLIISFLILAGIIAIGKGLFGTDEGLELAKIKFNTEERESNIKEENQKVAKIYSELSEHLNSAYKGQIHTFFYFLNRPTKYDISYIELPEKIKGYRKELLNFTDTKEDNKILDNLEQAHSVFFHDLDEIVKKRGTHNLQNEIHIQFEKKMTPTYSRICDKITESRKR